ncbi:hypothetical protein Tco_0885806 [Tanacetum coccineum]
MFTVPAPSPEPPPDHRSKVAVNGGGLLLTTAVTPFDIPVTTSQRVLPPITVGSNGWLTWQLTWRRGDITLLQSLKLTTLRLIYDFSGSCGDWYSFRRTWCYKPAWFLIWGSGRCRVSARWVSTDGSRRKAATRWWIVHGPGSLEFAVRVDVVKVY